MQVEVTGPETISILVDHVNKRPDVLPLGFQDLIQFILSSHVPSSPYDMMPPTWDTVSTVRGGAQQWDTRVSDDR